MSAHIRAGAVPRTEDASGAAVGCPQSVESAVFGTEYLFRTVEACFAHRVPLKTLSVQKKGVFMHRMPFPYRKRLFFTPNAFENTSRTPGSLFWHGMTTPTYPIISSAQWQRRPRHLPGHDGDWSGHSRTPPPQSGVGGSANCSRSASGRQKEYHRTHNQDNPSDTP